MRLTLHLSCYCNGLVLNVGITTRNSAKSYIGWLFFVFVIFDDFVREADDREHEPAPS